VADKLYWDINKLKLWDKNPRSITKKDFERLKKQIKDLGEYKPIIITPDGTVIGGNMRLRAYKELGVKKCWVSIVEPKDEAEKTEIALSDNDRAGYYDEDMLAELAYGLDIDYADYSVDIKEPTNLADLISNYAPDTDKDDDVPDAPVEPISKLGDVYVLGEHRLMCGDATKREDVEKLMAGKKSDMVFTDPPYNVDYHSESGNSYAEGKFIHKALFNDNLSQKEFEKFLIKVGNAMNESIKNNGAIYIWHGDTAYKAEPFYNLFKKMNWLRSSTVVWVKNNASMGWQHYRSQHEVASYGWKKNKPYFVDDRSQTTIWNINRDATQKYKHPTQKPVALMGIGIKNSSKKDDIVLDPFGGSGSTLIACEKLNRKCYMMELDPTYIDVIVERWETFSGKKAKKI